MARKSRKRHDAAPAAGPKVYKTAAYVRLSDEDIRKKASDSIGTQKAMLLGYLQSRTDMELAGIYEDVNRTGTNFNRPAFSRMIEDIRAGLVDCVLVKDLSRFGRSFEETGNYLERVFPSLGVRFISLADNYDSLTDTSDKNCLVVPLKNLINEVYAREISGKVQGSVSIRQRRGEFVGSFAPYGYIKNGPALVVDDQAAEVVRRIFEWIIEGGSDAAIAQRLNALKIPPPGRYRFEKGLVKAQKYGDARFWYKSAIKRISENPAYTGVMAQGRSKSNFLRGGGTTYTDRGQWIVVENTHPALIDHQTFEAVRKIREARKEKYRPVKNHAAHENIFKGLVVCGGCKSRMTRRSLRRDGGEEQYRFVCGVYEKLDKTACTRKMIAEDDLRTALHTLISNEIKLSDGITRVIADAQKRAELKDRLSAPDGRIGALQVRMRQNRRLRGSLREDYKDGILSEQDYLRMKNDHEEERDALQKELDLLASEKACHGGGTEVESKRIAEFRRFENETYLSPQMVSALVERIEVHDNTRIVVYLRYRGGFEALRRGGEIVR